MSSLSTQYSFAGGLGANQRLDWNNPGGDPFGADVGIDWAERPTVTYTPLKGENFSRRLLTPMPLEYVFLMAHSGWSVDRVLRCCVQGINNVFNAAAAAGPTPQNAPRFRDFNRVASILRQLQAQARLRLGRHPENEAEHDSTDSRTVLEIVDGNAPDVAELKQLLDLDPNATTFEFGQDYAHRKKDEMIIVPRSLLVVMFYLYQGVDIPAEHIAEGRATLTRDTEGQPFDWHEVHGDLFRVYSQESHPEDRFVSVHYRGHWFYIDDTDLDSKSTFVLLTFLFSLQAGGVRSSGGPTLTLPL